MSLDTIDRSDLTPAATSSATPTTSKSSHPHTTWRVTVAAVLAAATVVSLVLLAFVWPTYTSKVRNLPISVVAPAAASQELSQKLTASGVFTVQSATSRDEAVTQIQERKSYGAIVVNTDGNVEVLTASAASPVAAQAIQAATQQMGAAQAQQVASAKQAAAEAAATAGAQAAAAQASAQTLGSLAKTDPKLAPQAAAAAAQAKAAGEQAQHAASALAAIKVPTVKVTDVVPLSSHDQRGAGLALMALPLAMGGMIGGVLISMLVTGVWRRVSAVLGYGVLGGLLLIAVLNSWLGILQGGFLVEWAAMGLALVATAATIVGLNSLIGRAGIGVGAVITMFVGNPLSSMSAPVEMLAWHWGAIGQFFVPGAAGTLLRLESYFPQASTLHSWLVLAGWAVVGLVLTVVGHFRDQEVVHIDGATEVTAS